MTTMDIISLAGVLWVGGGALFIRGILMNPSASPNVAESSHGPLNGLLRLRPAALVALAFFIAIWPAVFVGAHIGRLRSNG